MGVAHRGSKGKATDINTGSNPLKEQSQVALGVGYELCNQNIVKV